MIYDGEWISCLECDSPNVAVAAGSVGMLQVRCRDCGMQWEELDDPIQLSLFEEES